MNKAVKSISENSMSLIDCQDSLGRVNDKIDVLSSLSATFAESQEHMNKNVANGMWAILNDIRREVDGVIESLGRLSKK